MNFTEAVAEVLRIVKRPDKVTDIRREVNAAVNFFSVDSDFPRDLQEILQPITASEYTQAIALSTFTRFRKFRYIKRAGTREFLRRLNDSDLFDTKCDLRDRYYIAGTNVNISMTKLASNLDIGWYQYPPVLTDAAPNYWMLEGNWNAVVNKAASVIFANIGEDSSARTHLAMATQAYGAFRQDAAKSAM